MAGRRRRRFNPWDRSREGATSAKSRLAGAKAQALGGSWEDDLAAACDGYRLRGEAYLRRVGAPFKCIGKQDRGKLLRGRYTGPGGCDLVGHLPGDPWGIPFEADAKHCAQTRWDFKLLEEHQAESLDRVAAAGGYAGLLLWIGSRSFWLPWSALGPRWWAWMQVRGSGRRAAPGTASVSIEDCEQLGVEFRDGHFLPAVVEGGRG